MKQIKTFAEACKKLKVKTTTLPDVSMLPEKHQKAIVAFYKLTLIAEVLNEGWQPDWSNNNEYKYQPYFGVKATKKNKGGTGFSGVGYVVWDSVTSVGSRLCFKNSELAIYAGEQFSSIYKDFLLIP